ncbi:2-octaprenyl-6-methoxyphenyl hydroxylase [Arenimonas sp.]|uniref:2-octaprenyl-6-methoxyphenyl hydroxylase n=1 Tax=Arenimonas sp. TaxID=1872635 RepID=UPI0039E26119
MSETLDILILGAGLVGSSLACALEGRGYRCALIEASPASAAPPGFDERKLALAAASLSALQALQVLPGLATSPFPIRRLHVSRAGDFGAVRLAAADYGRKAFGGVVLARELGTALESRMAALRDTRMIRPARVVALRTTDDAIEVDIEGVGTLRSRLLVAADGTRSFARQALGIGTQEHDYGQTLVVCSVACERAPDGTAYERFTSQGPVAMLPMGAHYGGICGVAREDAARVLALDDAGFADYLQQRFGWRAGRVVRVGKRSAYPIVRVLADRLTAPRAVLMGNAAQTIHPIGAQGFNLGLRDALTLAECLSEKQDPGSEAALARYVAKRGEDRERTLAFSDGLARLSANDSGAMRLLRSIGLSLLGNIPDLASPVVAGAMGYRGDVPALARGGA